MSALGRLSQYLGRAQSVCWRHTALFWKGASEVYVIDNIAERLERAKELGAVPIDFSHGRSRRAHL